MSNLYNWHEERMVELKMQEINREIEQARLLKEASNSGANRLARAVDALRSVLRRRRKGVQDHAPIEHESYQSLSDEVVR